MKAVLIIMSAACAAGLGCYAAFVFSLIGDQVMMNTDVFIAFIASLGVLAAILALAIQRAMVRSDDRLVRRLETRITELEGRAVAGERQAG